MIEQCSLIRKLSRGDIRIDIYPAGDDISVLLYGGERPHIGCTVLAVPRPSLTGDGSTSTTSSVINVTGHKDEMLCRMVAEELCSRYGCVVVCTGGFHLDKITEIELEEVTAAVRDMIAELQRA